MKKLLKLKAWLIVPDAARHLSILFGEDFTEADVLHLALDGHLTLSVDLVNKATVRLGKIIQLKDAKIEKIQNPIGGGVLEYIQGGGIHLGNNKVLSFSNDIKSIGGVWDLPMRGAERLDVEQKYQWLTEGPEVELTNLNGPLIYRQDGTWGQLLERYSYKSGNSKLRSNHPDNYHPAGSLPPDAVFVVRISALQDLEALLSEPKRALDRPLDSKQRRTLLVVIAALAKLARVDVTKPSKAAATIESEIARMGARVGVRTIEEHLKRIAEALESKAID